MLFRSGTVTVTGAAPSTGLVVSLSGGTNAQVDKTVTIPSGKTSADFIIKTKAVTVKSSATIKATYGITTATAKLTINP